MTLKYFKDQIHEELEGARNYIDKAIEVKPTHPEWSRIFVHMADMEADHAGTLMRILETCIKTKNYSDGTSLDAVSGTISAVDPDAIYKDLMKAFGETMTYVTNMKRGL